MSTIWLPELTEWRGAKYKGIAEAISRDIQQGRLNPDQKLPTHRALADALGVTTGTVTRAYAEAERRGLVYAVVGSGTFVRGAEAGGREWRFTEEQPEGLIELHLNRPLKTDRADLFARAMRALATHPAQINQLLDYQPDIGVEAHRRAICDWLARDGWRPEAEQVVISNGGQHALLVALMALTRAGDTVLAEALTYPGFTAAARQLKLQVRSVAMDGEGILPESLESVCRQTAPRVLFCTPSLQNPTTATMSPARRKAVLEICRRHELIVIEDEVSVGLAEGLPLPLAAFAPERTLLIGSFSKSLAAGVRVGYLVAPVRLQSRLGAAVRASCWMVSPLMVALVCEWIRDGSAQRLLAAQREEIAARMRIALQRLRNFTLSSQPGGLHLWLQLPEPWREDEFVTAAQARGVMVLGASSFCVGRGAVPHAVRISVSAAGNRQQLVKGLDLLLELLHEGPESMPALL
ncbi:MAG: PLP-dependent aminotransferase family protein [Gammaproteobacteria bacterium]|nr:PLP-dependent aminotransferase family protein [Gammaproteobacteria bacterium]